MLSGLSFSEHSDLALVACLHREGARGCPARPNPTEAAAIDWVKRDLVDEPVEVGTPIHPQLKVSHVQANWREVWNPPHTPAVAEVVPFLQHLTPGRQCEAVSFLFGRSASRR